MHGAQRHTRQDTTGQTLGGTRAHTHIYLWAPQGPNAQAHRPRLMEITHTCTGTGAQEHACIDSRHISPGQWASLHLCTRTQPCVCTLVHTCTHTATNRLASMAIGICTWNPTHQHTLMQIHKESHKEPPRACWAHLHSGISYLCLCNTLAHSILPASQTAKSEHTQLHHVCMCKNIVSVAHTQASAYRE